MAAELALLVIVSAFLHAAWNAILKRRPDPESAVVGVLVAAGVSSAILAVVRGSAFPPPEALLWSLLSGVVEAAYFMTLARALSRAPLGSVYTVVRGGALVLVWPVSIVFFAEHVTPLIALGTLLVLVGLAAAGSSESRVPALRVLEEAEAEAEAEAIPPPARVPALARASAASLPGGTFRGSHPSLAPMRRSAPSFADATDIPSYHPQASAKKTLRWAVICAVFAAAYQLGCKVALVKGGTTDAVVAITMLTAAAVQLVWVGRERRAAALSELRRAPLAIVGAGLLCTLGFVLFVRAMSEGGAGLLTTLRNTSILFAQGLALLGGERPKRLAVVGAIIVTAGAVLLSF